MRYLRRPVRVQVGSRILRKNCHTIPLSHLSSPVLDSKGLVKVVDCMPRVVSIPAKRLMCDAAIVQAARVSYSQGLKDYDTDKKLIHYLYKHRHTSPFEMVKFKFHVKAPIFVARQWFRHRMGNYNEISGRYSELNSDFYFPIKLPSQSKENKQLSGNDDLFKNDITKKLFYDYMNSSYSQHKLYKKLIKLGVSREIARIGLPQNLYTEFYWTTDLHNLFNFIKLRDSTNAQGEIKEYARVIKRFITELCPVSMEAFNEYKNINLSKNQLNGLQLKNPHNLKGRELDELYSMDIKKYEYSPFLL